MNQQSGRTRKITATKFYLLSAVGFCIIPPIGFSLMHIIDGTRPLITDFEMGAIVGVVVLRLMEAGRAASKSGETA